MEMRVKSTGFGGGKEGEEKQEEVENSVVSLYEFTAPLGFL